MSDAELYRFLASTQVGDILSFTDGTTTVTGMVTDHGERFLNVSLFNRRCRIRMRDKSTREHEPVKAGAVIGMESWHVVPGQIQRIPARQEHPERTRTLLRRLKPGDSVPLIGYPPLDGQRCTAKVLRVAQHSIAIEIKRKRARMYRTGPMAGVIDGWFWTLDTTGGKDESAPTVD